MGFDDINRVSVERVARVNAADTLLLAARDLPTTFGGSERVFDSRELFGKIQVPANWSVDREDSFGTGYRYSFHHPSQDVELAVSARTAPLSDRDSTLFKSILAQPVGPTGAKLLYDKSMDATLAGDPAKTKELASRVNSLSTVLGSAHVGDNQFSNTAAATDKNAPAFHLTKLELKEVNGKTVLLADGYFMNNRTAQPSSYFTGIFAPQERNGATIVNQIALQSGDRMSQGANQNALTKAIQSVTW